MPTLNLESDVPAAANLAVLAADPQALRAALAEVRRLGYAHEEEQSEMGMRSVAAPIRNSTGSVVGAVGIAGPVQRLSDAQLHEYAPRVVETAHVISVRLGYKALATF